MALPAHFPLPFAPFHRTLFDWHRRMDAGELPEREGLRFALAAPRGGAKSTIVSFLLLLHDIAYAREPYILLISATQRQAQQRLAAVRGELTGCAAFRSLFAPAFGRGRVRSSARTLLANGVRVDAFGALAEMRGVSHGPWRPTKIILDDAEPSAVADSPRARTRVIDWFGEVVEHLGAPHTHLLAIGTVLHREGLLAALLDRPDFESMRCRAFERFPDFDAPQWREWRRILTDPAADRPRETARRFFLDHRKAMSAGTEVLWPEREDCERLAAQLVLQGRRAFYQEKQNEPLGPDDALFRPESAWRARRTGDGVEILPPTDSRISVPARHWPMGNLRMFGYHDAAMGKGGRKRGDFAALAVVAVAPGGNITLLEMWVRRAPPSAQVTAILDAHERWRFERLGIEGAGFQELLTMPLNEEAKRRGLAPPIAVVNSRASKQSRIASLEPLLTAGRLALAEDLPEKFWRELADYPRTAHDDALDAAAGAVELALNAARKPVSRPVVTAGRARGRRAL